MNALHASFVRRWCEELREFVREAGFYGIRPLVEQAMPRLLKLRYGDNKQMLALLQAKGLA